MILPHTLPDFKRLLHSAGLSEAAYRHVLAFVATFLLHLGRMSAQQATHFERTRRRHLSTLTHQLAQLGYSRNLLTCVRGALFLLERQQQIPGTWVFALDATHRHSQAKDPENSFCSANKSKRPAQSKRKQLKYHRRHSHRFVRGLLLSPGGLRLPYWLPYYTKGYAALLGKPFRTEAQLGADLVDQVEVPQEATVVVGGDTAYEADSVRQACSRRGFLWVMPINPERVFAGPKPRRQVHALPQEDLSEHCFQPYRLDLAHDDYVRQRRLSASRGGPGKQPRRTYWVHRRIADVHSVGLVVLLFSKQHKPKAQEVVTVDKILMSNALSSSVAQVLTWYGLRWQVELFFKECKSVLGLVQYRVGKFAQVEGWVELCLLAFCYLEYLRATQLRWQDLEARQRQDWERARTGRLGQLLRQRLQEEEIERRQRWVGTKKGRRRLKQVLRAACPSASRPTGKG